MYYDKCKSVIAEFHINTLYCIFMIYVFDSVYECYVILYVLAHHHPNRFICSHHKLISSHLIYLTSHRVPKKQTFFKVSLGTFNISLNCKYRYQIAHVQHIDDVDVENKFILSYPILFL